MTNIINKVIKNGTEYQIYASGGAAIAVDSELSTTSTNPAQNKVITTAINSKAADNAVVKLTGNQTVAGTKTFSTSPVVPSKNSAASSSNKTVIATEAQVALKQDALTLPSSPTSGHIVTWGANNKTLADGGSIPTVNNSTITFTQGGVSKGTITTNQSSASTIALDAGGNYDNITKSEIQTGTATTQRTVSASVIKESLPRISSLPNNILTNCELWAGNLSDYKAMGDGRPSTTFFFCIDDGRLPIEYQEVEWIETTGTQFIDTGLFAGSNIQTEAKIEVTTTSQGMPVFGGYKNTSSQQAISGNYYNLTPYSSKWYYGLNNQKANAGTYSPTVGTQYTLIYNNTNNKISVNGTEIGNTTGTTCYAGNTLAISRRGTNRTGDIFYGQCKYFYFKMYNKTTGEYERDFVPCYRKSDNVIGMYDLVNDQFYTNDGTGTFNKGSDV